MRAFAKIWLPLLLTAAACDTTSAWAPGKRDVMGPVALDDKVAWVDPSGQTAFLLDPTAADLRPTMLPLGKNAVLTQKRTGSNELLVLTQGQRDEVGLTAETARLYAVPADPTKATRAWDLPSRFDQMAQSNDGHYAVLFFSSGSTKGGAETLSDPNQVAVVDLDPASATGATIKHTSLRSLGGVPQGVAFSNPFLLHASDAEPRTLAVFLSGTYVTLLDLTHPERGEISIDLKGSTSKSLFNVAQVIFDETTLSATAHPTIYLRGTSANDVVVVSIGEPEAATQTTANDFHTSASLLAAGTGPADMVLYDSTLGKRLLVVASGSQELLVIDPATSRTTNIKMSTQANRIIKFNEPATGKQRALLLALAPLSSTTLTFVDLDRIDDVLGQALDRHDMVTAASNAMAYPAQGVVIIAHGNQSGSQLSLVNLGTRKVSPLNSQGYDTLTFVPSSAGPSALDHLWVTSKWGRHVNYVTLATLATGNVRLDHNTQSVLPVTANGKRLLVVDHGGVGGSITILDADKPARSTARSVQGFLFTDYLERGAL
jgi:hypothetical protein